MSKPLIDIDADHLEIVRNILRTHVPHCEVWAFGSRVTGKVKPFSDLDLVVMTESPLPLRTSAALSDAFSDSDLPWKVDLVDWATVSESFRKIIAQQRVLIQSADNQTGSVNIKQSFHVKDIDTDYFNEE